MAKRQGAKTVSRGLFGLRQSFEDDTKFVRRILSGRSASSIPKNEALTYRIVNS